MDLLKHRGFDDEHHGSYGSSCPVDLVHLVPIEQGPNCQLLVRHSIQSHVPALGFARLQRCHR